MRMGFIPTMVRGRTTDPEYVGALAGLLEECEVESVWTV